jgi:peptidoglycan/LPS O-acetylase OafA/YrhL
MSKTLSPIGSASSTRVPSLDGLRAISIGLVLFGHLVGTRGFPTFGSGAGIGDTGRLGVFVFFVISGFLITTLLMHEYAAHRTISLKLFYARRSIRIFPATYGYLLVLGILSLLGIVPLTGRDFIHAVTYTINFEPDRSRQVGHLWSLSVEEQFYLLWPFAFAMLGQRKAAWAAFLVLFVGIAARVVNRAFLIGTPFHDLEMFPMVADTLATGCLLALLRERLEKSALYLRLFHRGISAMLFLAALAINRYSGYTLVSVFGTTLFNLIIAVLIHRSVYLAGSRIGRFLNARPLIFVGVLSYSLYVWQQLFLNRDAHQWINAFPQNLPLAICAALASYYLLERPFLGLRHRLRRKSE